MEVSKKQTPNWEDVEEKKYKNSHLWGFGFVLPIEELWQSSSLDLMDAERHKDCGISRRKRCC